MGCYHNKYRRIRIIAICGREDTFAYTRPGSICARPGCAAGGGKFYPPPPSTQRTVTTAKCDRVFQKSSPAPRPADVWQAFRAPRRANNNDDIVSVNNVCKFAHRTIYFSSARERLFYISIYLIKAKPKFMRSAANNRIGILLNAKFD